MIAALALAVFLLAAAGVYLLLERTLFRGILGLTLLAHAANLVVLSTGGWRPRPPIPGGGTAMEQIADPLPQALVLTAIVISMAVTLYLLAVMVATAEGTGTVEAATPPASDAGRDAERVRAELVGNGSAEGER